MNYDKHMKLIVLGSGLYWNKMIYIFQTDENCVKYDSRKTRSIHWTLVLKL